MHMFAVRQYGVLHPGRSLRGYFLRSKTFIVWFWYNKRMLLFLLYQRSKKGDEDNE